MVKMKQDLISLYAGKFPKIDSYNILTDMKRTILGIWSLITLIICFLSFYFLTLFQRELMVRFLHRLPQQYTDFQIFLSFHLLSLDL